MPIDSSLGKEEMVYIPNGILLSYKKEKIATFSIWMEFESIMYVK